LGDWTQSDEQWRELLADQVRQHARLWFRLAYDILRDSHAAEDVCQQALLRGWSNRQRLREPGLLRSWLARTVINESLAMLRRGKTEKRVLDDRLRLGDSHATPDDALATREAVMIRLDELSEDVRAVVALRIMQGMSGNEVKDLLGCSASQVSRMLHEGLEQLRSRWIAQRSQTQKEGSHDVR
jgi:RNA polymerase sigma-70 factor (ECF subfamily)